MNHRACVCLDALVHEDWVAARLSTNIKETCRTGAAFRDACVPSDRLAASEKNQRWALDHRGTGNLLDERSHTERSLGAPTVGLCKRTGYRGLDSVIASAARTTVTHGHGQRTLDAWRGKPEESCQAELRVREALFHSQLPS